MARDFPEFTRPRHQFLLPFDVSIKRSENLDAALKLIARTEGADLVRCSCRTHHRLNLTLNADNLKHLEKQDSKKCRLSDKDRLSVVSKFLSLER